MLSLMVETMAVAHGRKPRLKALPPQDRAKSLVLCSPNDGSMVGYSSEFDISFMSQR